MVSSRLASLRAATRSVPCAGGRTITSSSRIRPRELGRTPSRWTKHSAGHSRSFRSRLGSIRTDRARQRGGRCNQVILVSRKPQTSPVTVWSTLKELRAMAFPTTGTPAAPGRWSPSWPRWTLAHPAKLSSVCGFQNTSLFEARSFNRTSPWLLCSIDFLRWACSPRALNNTQVVAFTATARRPEWRPLLNAGTLGGPKRRTSHDLPPREPGRDSRIGSL